MSFEKGEWVYSIEHDEYARVLVPPHNNKYYIQLGSGQKLHNVDGSKLKKNK